MGEHEHVFGQWQGEGWGRWVRSCECGAKHHHFSADVDQKHDVAAAHIGELEAEVSAYRRELSQTEAYVDRLRVELARKDEALARLHQHVEVYPDKPLDLGCVQMLQAVAPKEGEPSSSDA